MQTIRTLTGLDVRTGSPRVVRLILDAQAPYFTLADDADKYTASIKPLVAMERYAIIGTPYGWLHSTAGDVRLWPSRSGARHALARYIERGPM